MRRAFLRHTVLDVRKSTWLALLPNCQMLVKLGQKRVEEEP